MTQGSLTERITRSLAYMLRHQPEEFDLELDARGFADLQEVVCALNERLGEPIEEHDVAQAIGSGDRPRYELVEDRIRALYGHSFAIDPGDPSEPPEMLYVGVGSRDAERAEHNGLRGGRRAFLHLALSHEDARETGRRISPDYAVITVHANRAWEDGIHFYDRQSLFLSEEIPTEYIEVGEMHSDGLVREVRGRGPRRGQPDRGEGRHRGARDDRGGRGGRGGRGDRDDRSREERSERPRRPERPRRSEEEAPRETIVTPVERAPAPAAPAANSAASGFGDGVYGGSRSRSKDDAPRESAESAEPAEKVGAQRRAKPDPAPAPEPESSSADDAGGFGLGVF